MGIWFAYARYVAVGTRNATRNVADARRADAAGPDFGCEVPPGHQSCRDFVTGAEPCELAERKRAIVDPRRLHLAVEVVLGPKATVASRRAESADHQARQIVV